MRLENTRINAIVVIIIPCCPLPSGPKICDITTAINKLKTADITLVPNVLMILPIKRYKFKLKINKSQIIWGNINT